MMELEYIKSKIKQKPFYENEKGLLYNADCIDIIKDMPDMSVNLIKLF